MGKETNRRCFFLGTTGAASFGIAASSGGAQSLQARRLGLKITVVEPNVTGPAAGAAISGIDMALWEIKGKAYGVPVYQLRGALARTKVRIYGAITGNTAAEAAAQAKERASRGIA